MSADAALSERINQQVERIANSSGFEQAVDDAAPTSGDVMVINNSFLYRDAVATRKSRSYLAVPVDDGGPTGYPGVIELGKMDATFKHVAQRSENLPGVAALDGAIAQQLEGLGAVVFSLIGTIDEGAAAEVTLGDPVPTLRYEPQARERVRVADGALVIGTLEDPESTWREAAGLLEAEGHEDQLAQLGAKFAEAVGHLREQAPRRITPTTVDGGGDRSLLGQIEAAVREQVVEYRQALDHADGNLADRDARNTVLRISYNFASDATDLLRLFVSVCDLKPILLWLTVAEHYEAAQAFARLPFGLETRKKPSLKVYREIISGARNRAFHDFFAFDRPFEVDLAGVPLHARRLLLFQAHGRGRGDAFDYEDRELVEVLQQFTRAPERAVSAEFWQRNLEVLEATAALTASMRQALQLLAKAVEPGHTAGG